MTITWTNVLLAFPLVFLGRLGWLLAEDAARVTWGIVVTWAGNRRDRGKPTIRVA